MIRLVMAALLLVGCAGQGLDVMPWEEAIEGDAPPAVTLCDIGAPGTFQADNCDGTNGPGNGKVLCWTHDSQVVGCWVAYASGVAGEGAPAYQAECVAVCP